MSTYRPPCKPSGRWHFYMTLQKFVQPFPDWFCVRSTKQWFRNWLPKNVMQSMILAYDNIVPLKCPYKSGNVYLFDLSFRVWTSKSSARIWRGVSLQWRHKDHDSVSNHQPHGSLLNRLFRRRSKKTSKLRVTGLCVGNSPGPVDSPNKWPLTRKMFPFDDVIMW